MHYMHALIITYILNIYLIINNTAVCLSLGHRKRELNFNNYPANRPIVDPREYNNYYQQNTNNDPGYTTQNENNNNNDNKTSLSERTANTTTSQNFVQFNKPSGQMYHLMYMQHHPNKRQETPANYDVNIAYNNQLHHHSQQLNINNQNLDYAGPHLFPTTLPNNYQNIQQSNLPAKHFNTALHNIYPAQFFLRPYHQDSKIPSKMEAPFIPSQFLGYGQEDKQQLPQQQQQLPHQYQQFAQQQQQLPQQYQQQNQQFHQQLQQTVRPPVKMPLTTEIKPVYEEHQVSPYHSPNLIYMAPSNVYDFYRKSN